MRIMQIIPWLKIGGAERMCESLTLALTELGHEVIIVSMFNRKTIINHNLEEKGIKIEYIGKHVGIDFSIYFKLNKLIKKYNPDVVHTHLNALKYSAGIAFRDLHQPVIHTLHSIAEKEAPKFDIRTNKRIYASKKAVPVALTSTVQDSIELLYELPKESIPIIYNGIDIRKFNPSKDYSFKTNKIRIVNVASFSQPKNQGCLIEAFMKLHRKYPNTILSLAGTGPNMEQIQNLVQKLDLSSSVEFLGSVDNVSAVLEESDIFVLPSTYEGMPMSIIEAMASGLPIVASRVGGIPDMIDDGNDGILIDPTVNSLYLAIEKLINDQCLRERLGKNARKKSEGMSSFIMAENYLALYRKIREKGRYI